MSEPALKLNRTIAKAPASSVKAKTRTPSKKSFTIKRPSVRVHGYYEPTTSNGTTYHAWRVVYTFQGKRIRQKFSDYDDAYTAAETIANRLENGNTALFNLTTEQYAADRVEIAAHREWKDELRKRNKTFQDALNALDKLYPSHIKPRSVPDLVAEMINAKSGAGLGELHTHDLEVRLNRFARTFQCPITALTFAAVDKWLRELKHERTGKLLSLRSRNNYRSAIFALVDYAKTVKALPKDWSEIDPEELTPAKTRGKTIEIWTPGEMTLLLQSAETLHQKRKVKDLVPYLATGAFAGPRSAELQRTDWIRNVRFESEVLKLGKDITKTERSRDVPIKDNLKAWLAPYRHTHGCLCPYRTAAALHTALRNVAKHAGLRWKKNALRDSSISYCVAMGVPLETVADWHGNSVGEIHENYLLHPDRKDAEAWFNILPIAADQKVLNLFA